jgi:hypothetical protein
MPRLSWAYVAAERPAVIRIIMRLIFFILADGIQFKFGIMGKIQ